MIRLPIFSNFAVARILTTKSYLATLETSETTSEVLERSEALEAVCPMKTTSDPTIFNYPRLVHGAVLFVVVFRSLFRKL